MSFLLDLAATVVEALAIYATLILVVFLWIRRSP